MKKEDWVMRRIACWRSKAWLAVLLVAGNSQIAGAQVRPRLPSHTYLLAQPAPAEDHFRQASRLDAPGKLDEAIAEYSQAIRLNPKYQEAHFRLALAPRARGTL